MYGCGGGLGRRSRSVCSRVFGGVYVRASYFPKNLDKGAKANINRLLVVLRSQSVSVPRGDKLHDFLNKQRTNDYIFTSDRKQTYPNEKVCFRFSLSVIVVCERIA